jgi:hypothetical protein
MENKTIGSNLNDLAKLLGMSNKLLYARISYYKHVYKPTDTSKEYVDRLNFNDIDIQALYALEALNGKHAFDFTNMLTLEEFYDMNKSNPNFKFKSIATFKNCVYNKRNKNYNKLKSVFRRHINRNCYVDQSGDFANSIINSYIYKKTN